jgi:hypothetical protein
MMHLTPERRLCLLFDQASSLQDSELSEEECYCKRCFANLFFPTCQVRLHCCMDSQLVG